MANIFQITVYFTVATTTYIYIYVKDMGHAA